MKKLLLLLALIQINNANAISEQNFNANYKQEKQKLLASLDYCSNLGSNEIFKTGTLSLAEIKKNKEQITKDFNTIKTNKNNCFDNSNNFLNDIIAASFAFNQKNKDTLFLDMQINLDQKLSDVIYLRKKINNDLISSILADIDQSLANTKEKDLADSFIKESSLTKKLISQELNIIYNTMEQQLKLDKNKLELSEESPNIVDIANISLRSAFINLSRSLLIFENIEKSPKAYNIAQIKSYVDMAHNKLLELKAFSKDLDDLDSKKEINKIINQLSILTVNLEVTLKDLSEDTFSDNFLNWAGQVYQQTSKVIEDVQKVLDTVYLLDITKEPLPIDITIKEEELSFAPVKPINNTSTSGI